MAPGQIVEEFRTASRALLKLFRSFALENRLSDVEESIIAAKIDALRVAFPEWKKRRVRMPPSPLRLTVARAEKLIVAEWRRWAKKHGSNAITDMQLFYFGWLKQKKPKLLTFKCQGDPWHVVLAWLQHDKDRRVKRRRF